jgi:molecular chaperone HscC
MMQPLIQRNSVVPISRSDIFCTVNDDQSRVDLKVYQGENLRPQENIFIGELIVHVPLNKAGAEGIETRFTYDVNGALEVEAKVISSGSMSRAVFNSDLGLSEEALNQRFAALSEIKVHPRDRLPNQALIARAERLYSEHLADKREFIRQRLLQFLAELDNSRTNGEAERLSFSRSLDPFEERGFNT